MVEFLDKNLETNLTTDLNVELNLDDFPSLVQSPEPITASPLED
jgi:hypothetical protein